MDELSERRLAENEVIFRRANEGVAEFLKDEGKSEKPVSFYCECSNPNCRERVRITAKQYTDWHQSVRHFIALKGHEIPAIEKIVRQEGDYAVLEKYDDPPSDQETDRALKNIASE